MADAAQELATMAFLAYLAFSVAAIFALLLAIFLDDAQLATVVLVVVLACAGLWWVLSGRHHYHTR
jgi:hypothetical protein